MLFNSFQFAFFFTVFFCLYLAFPKKWQNRALLGASYVFYGAWDWRFLSLILISTILDYICGIQIDKAAGSKIKKLFLFCSICGNLLILGFFKYFNFFTSAFQALLSACGLSFEPRMLHIILPAGISFYTFKTMSYTIEIYRGHIKPSYIFFDYALFVAFFPQLLAGPIERPQQLLTQISSPRRITVNKLSEGCCLIFWGLFQKVFIADNLAGIVDPYFSMNNPYNGFEVLLGVYAYTFQILCDFAGYSNMARGLGKCMGFEMMINFNRPYSAVNPSEFWQRWHISLSTWFRDYLYIPLGGNRHGIIMTCRNLAITMFLCGLWHGAAWTFVIWGCYHSILLITHRLLQPFFAKLPLQDVRAEGLGRFIKASCFFQLIALGWLFFRAESLEQGYSMLASIFCCFSITSEAVKTSWYLLFFICPLLLIQLFQKDAKDILYIRAWPQPVKYSAYAVMFYCLFFYGASAKSFIYFQF